MNEASEAITIKPQTSALRRRLCQAWLPAGKSAKERYHHMSAESADVVAFRAHLNHGYDVTRVEEVEHLSRAHLVADLKTKNQAERSQQEALAKVVVPHWELAGHGVGPPAKNGHHKHHGSRDCCLEQHG